MAIDWKEEHEISREDFKQISGANMQICFTIKGPDLVINNSHAPQSWLDEEIRAQWFDDYTEHLLLGNAKLQLSFGDFNTRFHAKRDGEQYIGKRVFGRGLEFLSKIKQPEKLNRTFMAEMLDATTHTVMIACFAKPDSKLVTFKESLERCVPQIGFYLEKFAPVDFCLASEKAKNTVTNVETDTWIIVRLRPLPVNHYCPFQKQIRQAEKARGS